jgi:hypothetical protein
MIVLVIIGAAFAWRSWAQDERRILLDTLLSGRSYRLEGGPRTIANVIAIVPRLIEAHRRAVVDCKGKIIPDLRTDQSWIPVCNQRIRSWQSILMAIAFTGDKTAIGYVDTFINSKHAWLQEVIDGKNALARTRAPGQVDGS